MQGAGNNGNVPMKDTGSHGMHGMPAPGSIGGESVDPNAPPAGNFPRDYSRPQAAPGQPESSAATPQQAPPMQRPTAAPPTGVRAFGASTQPAVSAPEFPYRPQGGLAKMLAFFLSLAVLVHLVSAGSTVLTLNFAEALLRGAEISQVQITAEGMRQFIVSTAELGSWLVCVILFCVWVSRANKNARGLGAEGLQTSPGWCAGWFFIPFAFWVKPYQAVREIWQASDPSTPAHSTTGWQGSEVGGAVFGWWTMWLLGVWGPSVAYVFFSLIMKSPNVSTLLWVIAIGHLLTAVAGVMAISVVSGIESRQRERAHTLAARATQQKPVAAAA